MSERMVEWHGTRRGGIQAAFVALAMLASIVSTPLLAQAFGQAPQPAVRQSVDDNGVDVIQGAFVAQLTDLTIGPDAKNGLSFQRISGIGGVNTLVGVIEGGNGSFTVTLNGQSDSFPDMGSGTMFSSQGNGATLVNASGTYIYTSRDGTVARFAGNTGFTYTFYQGEFGRLGSITYADGSTTTFTQKVQTICPGGYDGNVCQSQLQYVTRLQSATNTNGYQLKFTYALNTTKIDADNYAAWGTITAVTAINNAVEYCDPAADTCSLANAWPSATFSGGTVTDALGRSHSGTGTTTVAYDGNGHVGSITRNGVTYTYTYADAGTIRTTTVTDPNGGQRIYTGDTLTSLLSSFRDELGHTTSYAYDTNGRLTQTTFPEGNAVQYTYDGRGNATQALNIAKQGSGLGNTATSAVFPPDCANPKTCNKPTSTTDARGQTTTYTYDDTHGGVLTVTAPATAAGVQPQTRYSYTPYQAYYQTSPGAVAASGFPIYKLTGVSSCRTAASCAGTVDETVTSIGYGPQDGTPNNLLQIVVTRSAGDGSISATTATAYDNIGNVLTSDGPLPGPTDTTRLRYDAARQLVGTVSPDPDGPGPLNPRAVRYTYNNVGQPTLVEFGTVADQLDGAWSAFSSLEQQAISYDGNLHQVQTAVTAGGTTYAVSQTSYDALGRVDCIAQRMNPDAFGALPAACSLGTTGSFGPDRVARNGYDAASEQTSLTTGYGTADQRTEASATYTPNGKIATAADGKGNLTTYAYDGFDRLLTTSYPSPTAAGTSSATDFEQLSYDTGGNVISRRLRDGNSIGYAYDNLNRLITKTLPNLGGDDTSVAYTYDNPGDLLLAAKSATDQASFTYDALGRKTGEGNTFYSLSFQYDAAGNRTGMTWNDGFTVAYDHFFTGEVQAIRENGATSGIGVLATYTYDNLGNRTALTRGNGTVTNYGFDPASRLTQLDLGFISTAANLGVTLAYNPAGQITSRTGTNNVYAWTGAYDVTRPYTSNGLNQYTTAGSVTPTYDARSNTTSAGAQTYQYTSQNRLWNAPGQTTLLADALERLDQVSAEGVALGYDGANMVGEYSVIGNTSTIVKRYVFGPGADEPLVWYDTTGSAARHWLHADERGSIIATSDDTGTSTATNTYDEFGIPSGSNVGRYQYTGQKWLPSISLYDFKSRIYSPTLGRFLQADPIGYGDGLNSYNYVHSDPINKLDSSGLCSLVSTNYFYYFSDTGEYDYLFTLFSTSDCDPQDERNNRNTDIGSGSGGASVGTNSSALQGTQNGDITVVAYKPRPYVPDAFLPKNSADVLTGNRFFNQNGDINLYLPNYSPIPAPRGGGVLMVPPGYKPGSRNGVVRVQPAGTGSAQFNPGGYYIVYDSAGRAIDIYTGQPYADNNPLVHNPLGPVLPGGPR